MTETLAPADLTAELETYRVELTGYCYRMLGSSFEAEDAVQETMLRAWKAAERFEGRSSLRSWLYRIATNVCFDSLTARQKRARPMDLGPCSGALDTLAPKTPESAWVAATARGARPAGGAALVRRRGRRTARYFGGIGEQRIAARPRHHGQRRADGGGDLRADGPGPA